MGLIPSIKVSIENRNLVPKHSIEKSLPLFRASEFFQSPKILKDANKVDLPRSSNFSVATGLISSLKIGSESLAFVKENLFQKYLIWSLGWKFPVVWRSSSVLIILNLLHIQAFFPIFIGLIASVKVSIGNFSLGKMFFLKELSFPFFASES